MWDAPASPADAPHIHTSRIMTDFSGSHGGFPGTFAPFFLASDRPIAIACLRLLTFPPRPPGPLLSVPFLRLRMALSTDLLAALP